MRQRVRPSRIGPIRCFEDVARHIDRSAKPVIKANRVIRFLWWESDLVVLRSYETLLEMAPGEILRAETDRIATYPDVHAWVRQNPKFVLLGEDYEEQTIIYYLTRTLYGEKVIDIY